MNDGEQRLGAERVGQTSSSWKGFARILHGKPAKLSQLWGTNASSVDTLSDDRWDGSLPLAGLKVIDFTRVLAGPLCTMLLGDMGAEVIKIEDPRHGDDTRAWAPFVGRLEHVLPERQPQQEERRHRSEVGGRPGAAEDLIREADVLVENFRPGTLERLGFGPEQARALNERLIYCSISGYGTTGPRRDEPGYDMVIQGESGLMDVTGFPETGPTKVGVAITDCLAALYAVQGILLAHIQRMQTGQGTVPRHRAARFGGVGARPARRHRGRDGQSPGRLGNAHPSLAPYEPYPAADGHVVVAVANPRLWSRFCAAMGAECSGARSSIRQQHRPPRAPSGAERAHSRAVQGPDRRRADREARGRGCALRPRADDRTGALGSAARRPADAGRHSHRRRAVKVPGNPIKLSGRSGAGWRRRRRSASTPTKCGSPRLPRRDRRVARACSRCSGRHHRRAAVLILFRVTSVLVALVLVPLAAALIGGFAGSFGSLAMDGIRGVTPVAALLAFAVIYFGVMNDAGLFDPIIRALVRVVGTDPVAHRARHRRRRIGRAPRRRRRQHVHGDGAGHAAALSTAPA